MKRIHWHWTAGGYTPNAIEKKHYHFLVTGDGTIEEGDLAPEANRTTSDGIYAAHTRAANTGAIGVAVCAMLNARERPFLTGPCPITAAQVDALIALSADLCETYGIPVTDKTTLTHAEVQTNLGIAQRGKWDINWLPGMTEPVSDPRVTGRNLRARLKAYMDASKIPPAPEPSAGLFAAILTAFAAIFRRT